MNTFTSTWLALREPSDVAARSARLAHAVADHVGCRNPLRIVDLGAGTGANARYLARWLQGNQEWWLVDHDEALLREAGAQLVAWATAAGNGTAVGESRAVQVQYRDVIWRFVSARVDLAAPDSVAIVKGAALVTSSALLDLVSERWIGELVTHCRAAGATVLFALTYDGRLACSPAEPEDDTIRRMVNAHQRTDKGFGPALGSAAVDRADQFFQEKGYRVQREPSDWVLNEGASALQTGLIVGWAEAAGAVAPDASAMIRAWRDKRLAHVAANRSRLLVGHQDLAAWLP